MKTERRCTQRKRPGGISYFEFEAGSGGIVLDASEKGLAFQAADAVHQVGSNRIFISPHPEERIELNADVVWTDRSKKSGGLRFIDPGADSCIQIRNWLKHAGESGVSQQRQEYPLPSWAVEEVGDLPRARSHPQKSPIPSPPRVQAREHRPVVPRPAQNLPLFPNSDVTWQPRDSSGIRHGVLHDIATGFLIAAFVFGGVALVENFGFVRRFRPRVANALIRLGEKLNGTPISSPLPDRPKVPTPPRSPVPSIPDASQQGALRSSDQAHSSAPNNSETPSPAIPRTREEAHHSASSRTPGLAQGRSVEASRLWSAVEAGSPAAELDLARLYLKGEGVPRNCEQAWILLRAATKGGSREARQQLQKLRRYGCR
jgi:PilZ domain